MTTPETTVRKKDILSDYLMAVHVGTSPSGKTEIWDIVSRSRNDTLGEVRWLGGWRQYVFRPDEGTIWNEECLRDVAQFCRLATKARSELRSERDGSHS